MNILTLDFETYYDADYTLKKLTTEAYIRDARFETLCVGTRLGGSIGWQTHESFVDEIRGRDWSDTVVLCHHAQFDGLILSHHYGIRPKMFLDTMSMARLVLGTSASVSLDNLTKYFNLPAKTVPYDMFKGRHWGDLSTLEQATLGDSCAHDVELTWRIYQKLAPLVPSDEFNLIDLTVKMFTNPIVQGDVAELERIAAVELSRKQAAMDTLGVSKKELSSDQQFAAILTGLGVEVEYKTTPKGNSKPAVAKTDAFMQGLLEDENEIIAGLASARLDAKSSIDETRAGRLAASARRGPIPIYLGYCAAHTLRWGGGDKVNFQNFRRGGEIRKALMAPEGHLLLVADSSQIECRFLEWEAGETEALEDFRKGGDPYIGIASEFYGRPITKSDKAERGMGKQIRLSCGYGAGGDSIVATAKRGTYGPPVILTPEEGLAARNLYRNSRQGVVSLWRQGDLILAFIGNCTAPEETLWPIGPKGSLHLQVRANGDGSGAIIAPNGAPMLYQLEWDEDAQSWKRKTRRGWARLWGGVVVQNLTEMLSRQYIGEVMRDVKGSFDYPLAWMSHDELVYVVKDDHLAQHKLNVVLYRMRLPPDWAPDIPLDAEGSLSRRYEK